jgi:hypothetical protein
MQADTIFANCFSSLPSVFVCAFAISTFARSSFLSSRSANLPFASSQSHIKLCSPETNRKLFEFEKEFKKIGDRAPFAPI